MWLLLCSKLRRKLIPKQARWKEYLEHFDFVREHKPGRDNIDPDALSRRSMEVAVAISKVESCLE